MTLRDKSRVFRAVYSQVNGSTGVRTSFGKTMKLIRTTDGSENPRWRDAISRMQDATGSLVATADECYGWPGECYVNIYKTIGKPSDGYWTFTWGGYRAAYEVIVPTAYDGSLVSVAEARANSNFNKDMRRFSSAMQGGVFIGELREAFDMLRRPAASLFEGLGKYLDLVNIRNKAKRKKRRSTGNKTLDKKLANLESVRNISKIAAESWLELSFGWRPFVNDIEDAFNAIDNLRNDIRIENVSGGGEASSQYQMLSDVPIDMGYLASNRTHSVVDKCHVRYKGAIKIEPQTSNADIAKNWGVHTSQFIPTAWELLPWSFLADYFGNIGDILNYDSSVKSQLIWCAHGIKQTRQDICSISHNAGRTQQLAGARYAGSGGSSSVCIYKRSSITRAKSNGGADLTLSDFHFKIPTVPTQWLNMAALLASGNSIHAQRFNRL